MTRKITFRRNHQPQKPARDSGWCRRCTIHSLAESSFHPVIHPHHIIIGVDESYWILSGVATLNIDGNIFELTPGEAVLIQPMEVHQISNQTDEALIFLAVCVPAWSPEDSFEIE